MKKMLVAMAMALMMVAVMTSCGSSTPSDVAEKAVKCMKNGDVKGYLALTDMPKDQIDGTASMLKEKAAESLKEKGGIKSYDVVSEDIDEEKGRATVTMKLVYGNGDESEEKMDLKKNDDGDWVLSSKK